MAVTNVVKLSGLERARRIDAEYYDPSYLEVQEILSKIPTKKLSALCEITDGNHMAISDWFTNEGIRYLRGQDLVDFFISDSDPVFIPYSIFEKLKRSHIFPNDVLVSIVGTIGLVSIVGEEFDKLTANCKIAILHPRDINPWLLATFLYSKYGQYQIKRRIAGAVQTGVILKDLATIKIPNFSNSNLINEIERILKNAHNNHKKSKALFSQAENLLLEELGLKDFKPKYELSYIANLSQAFGVHRVDAEYFQPVYHQLIKYLKSNFEVKPLKTFILNFQKGIEVGSENYQEEGKPFIRVSNLSIHGFVERDQKYIDGELYQKLKDTYEPKVGDFLLTKDATPGIAYLVKEPVEGIIASGILKLTIDENSIDKEYLALCINSIVGRLQIERDGGGSVITHWKPEQIKNLQIPILPPDTQQKIASLVRQSHEARKKAKELLEEAKREVEKAIENEINK